MSEAVSAVASIAAPSLMGVWVFDPIDPDGTERQYLHAAGTAEEVDAVPTELQLVGRANPLVEYGEAELVGVKLAVTVPFGPRHAADVDAWRNMLRNRRAICYRDNRGRLVWSSINAAIGIADIRSGTALSISLRRVDYDEAI